MVEANHDPPFSAPIVSSAPTEQFLRGGVMPALLPLIGLVAWPLTLGAAVVVFGVSSQGTLGLISEHVRSPAASASVTAQTPVVVKMLAPVAIAPPQADRRLSALTAGRPLAAGAATLPKATDASVPTMKVTTSGLIVRSHPIKAGPQVGVLTEGEPVEVRAKHGGWFLVTSAGGTVGWVFGKYLSFQPARPRLTAFDPSKQRKLQ